jgi:hypothetical protein
MKGESTLATEVGVPTPVDDTKRMIRVEVESGPWPPNQVLPHSRQANFRSIPCRRRSHGERARGDGDGAFLAA